MPGDFAPREGEILTGSLFSEPMRVETVRSTGPASWVPGLLALGCPRSDAPPVLPERRTASVSEFESRAGNVRSPRGAKRALVQVAISSFAGSFTLAGLERACPEVSQDMIRRVLTELKQQKVVECVGRGPGASWRRLQ